jgi:CheY-like chemotaxis protein
MDRSNPLILVVEDHPEFRHVLKSLIESHGMQCVTADSVMGGLDLAWQDRPDLAIVDWNLPDGTGGELIQSLRAIPELDRTAVAVCTANQELKEQRTALRAGADAFWPKARLDVDQLGQQIRDLIESRRQCVEGRNRPDGGDGGDGDDAAPPRPSGDC